MADLKLSLILRAVDKGAKKLVGSTKAGIAGLTAENKKAAGVQQLVERSTRKTGDALKREARDMLILGAATKKAVGAQDLLLLSTAHLDSQRRRLRYADAMTWRSMAKGALKAVGVVGELTVGLGLLAAVAAGAAAVVIPTKLFKFGERQAKEVAALGREAKTAGVSIAELQELQEAFRLNDKDLGGAADLYKKLGLAELAAFRGGKEQVKLFRSIGVSVRDQNGQLKPVPKLLEEAADGYSKIRHEQKRALVAQALFGASVDEIDPILRDGARGLRDYALESRRNGQWNEQNRREAAAARRSYLQMTGSIHGLVNVASGLLFPIVTKVSDALRDWFRDPGNRTNILKSLTEGSKQLVKALPVLLPKLTQLMDVASKLITQTDWEKAADDMLMVAKAVVILARAIAFLAKVGGAGIDLAQAASGNGQPLAERLMRDQEKRRRARAASGAGPEPGFWQPAKPAGVPYQSLGPGRAKPAKGQIDITVRHDGPPKVTTRSGDMAMTVYRGAH